MDCKNAAQCCDTSNMLSTGSDLGDGGLSRQVEAHEMRTARSRELSKSVAEACTCEDSEDQDMFYMPMPSPKMLLSAAVPSHSHSQQAAELLSPIRVPIFDCETKEEAVSEPARPASNISLQGSASLSSKINLAFGVCQTEDGAGNKGLTEPQGAGSQSPISGLDVGVCEGGNMEAAELQTLEFQLPQPMDPASMILDACSPHTLPSQASKKRLVYMVFFLALVVIVPAIHLHPSGVHQLQYSAKAVSARMIDQTYLSTTTPSTCGCKSHGNDTVPLFSHPGVNGTAAEEATAVQGAAEPAVCAVQSLARLHLCDSDAVVIPDAGTDGVSSIQDSTVPLAALAVMCFAQILASISKALGSAVRGKPTTRQTVDKSTSPRRDMSQFPYIINCLHTSTLSIPAHYSVLLPANYSTSSVASLSAGRIPVNGPVSFFSRVPSSPTSASRATPHASDSVARSSVSRTCRSKLPRVATEMHEDAVVKTLRSGRSYEAKVLVPVQK